MNYRRYLQSEHWKELSAAKLEDANFRCERCHRRTQLEVHHLHYNSIGKERFTDLEVLCRACHQKHHDSEFAAKTRHAKPEQSHPCTREMWREKAMGATAIEERLQKEFEAAARSGQKDKVEAIYAKLKKATSERKTAMRKLS